MFDKTAATDYVQSRYESLKAAMLSKHGLVVLNKDSLDIMRSVAAGMGVAALMGANLPTYDSFMEDYATQLGPFCFIPKGWSDNSKAIAIVHECGHWLHNREDHLYPLYYLTSKPYRVGAEVRAIAGEEQYLAGMGWALQPIPDAGRRIHSGYLLEEPWVSVASDMLRSTRDSLFNGMLAPQAATALAIMREPVGPP